LRSFFLAQLRDGNSASTFSFTTTCRWAASNFLGRRQFPSQFSPVGTIVTQITSSAYLAISPDAAIKHKNGIPPETKIEVKKQRTTMMQTQFTE
jgi:hypothetical protein